MGKRPWHVTCFNAHVFRLIPEMFMDVTPPNEPTKRRRAKIVVKVPAAQKAARKTPARQKASTLIVTTAAAKPKPHDQQARIATAAFYIAAERNFAPGHELDDWLEAERRVKLLDT